MGERRRDLSAMNVAARTNSQAPFSTTCTPTNHHRLSALSAVACSVKR